MAVFLLVPGAWHGAWCWARLAPLLQAAGHEVIAPDLVAVPAGENPLPVWAAQIAALARAAPAPVLLLGHSRGGVVVQEAAALAPDAVRACVYLAAFMLPVGESLQSAMAWPEAGAPPDYLRPARGQCVRVAQEAMMSRFYPHSPVALAQEAAQRLHPEPLGAFSATVTVPPNLRPAIYIECSADQVIPLALQRAMQAASPPAQVVGLNADHSPFLSQPEALFALLDQAAGTLLSPL